MQLSKNLKKLRKEKQLTLQGLAEKSGLSFSVVASLVAGRTENPELKTLVAIADAMEVGLDELIGRVVKK